MKGGEGLPSTLIPLPLPVWPDPGDRDASSSSSTGKSILRRSIRRFFKLIPSMFLMLFVASLVFVTLMQIAVIHSHRKIIAFHGPGHPRSNSELTSSTRPSLVPWSTSLRASNYSVQGSSLTKNSGRGGGGGGGGSSTYSSFSSSPSSPPSPASSKKKTGVLKIEALLDKNLPSRDINTKILQNFVNSARIREIIQQLQGQGLLGSNQRSDLLTQNHTLATLNVFDPGISSSNPTSNPRDFQFNASATLTQGAFEQADGEGEAQEQPKGPEERNPLQLPSGHNDSRPVQQQNEHPNGTTDRTQGDMDTNDLDSIDPSATINGTSAHQRIDSTTAAVVAAVSAPATGSTAVHVGNISTLIGQNWMKEVNESHWSLQSSSNNGTSAGFLEEGDKRSPCPLIPPELLGRIKIDMHPTQEQFDCMVNQSIVDGVRAGGSFHPSFCLPRHRVAIIIPYRDRLEHLQILLYHLHPILRRQLLEYRIYVVEQAGTETFNKGVLMNAGVRESLKDVDYHCFIFHDVDLIPEDDRNMYSCPFSPRHMSYAVDKFNYQLPYSYLVGGVFSISKEHFIRVNGYSNLYWGWGGEDDDMAHRLKLQNLQIIRPPASIGRYTMIKHSHRAESPSNVRSALLRMAKKRAERDGLSSVKYRLIWRKNNSLFTHLLIEISHIHKWHFPSPNKLVLHF